MLTMTVRAQARTAKAMAATTAAERAPAPVSDAFYTFNKRA